MVSLLSSVFTDWQVSYDSLEYLFYFTPPLSGNPFVPVCDSAV